MDNEKLIDLISKKLTGSISQEDSLELTRLLHEKENEQLFESLKSKWAYSANYKPAILTDTQKSWENFSSKSKIKPDSQPVKQKQQWMRPTWMRVAALVLLSMSITYSYLWLSPSGKSFNTAKGQQLNIQLPDGTKVKLEESSSLSYNKDYNKTNREVDFKGFGYFDVAKDEHKPFLVHGDATEIRVLGTSFSVDAYADKKYVEVIVSSGKVSFLEKTGMKNTVLTKGMKVSYNTLNKTMIASRSLHDNAEVQLIGDINFKDSPLTSIFVELEATFGKQFTISNKEIGSCKFTGSFNAPTLTEILEVLAASLNVRISQQGSRYHVEGEGCH